MPVYINTDLTAMRAARMLYGEFRRLHDTTRRLVTGSSAAAPRVPPLRDHLAAEVRGVGQEIADTNDRIGMHETAGEALAAIRERLLRMRELADQAFAGDASKKQLAQMDKEYRGLAEEVTALLADTEYNGTTLLSGGDALVSLDLDAVIEIRLKKLPDDATANLSMAIAQTVAAQGQLDVGLPPLQRSLGYLADQNADLLAFEDRIAKYESAMQGVEEVAASIQTLSDAALAAQANLSGEWALHLLAPN